ncbi:ATP-binding protein [Lewinella sp. LCG006]|uniref:sensor histidine kinase n=1 Tax=Lewinella sp. LCG006 TaxID=3231911 RepID=UPI00345FEDC8
MGLPLRSATNRFLLSWSIILLGALGSYLLTGQYLPALFWVFGHFLGSGSIPRLDQPIAPLQQMGTQILPGFLAGGSLLAVLIATQLLTRSAMGWRGFLHLTDLPLTVWGSMLSLVPLALGCWLMSLRQMQLLQAYFPDRRIRLLLLLGYGFSIALLAYLPWLELHFLPLFLSLIIYLFSLDIYLENERTSMTWLLVWLLLISFLIAAFSYQRSLVIDQQTHQTIAQDIARNGIPDTTRQYHLEFQWDTLSTFSAPGLLSEKLLNIPPGTGSAYSTGERNDWVYRQQNGEDYVVVGRKVAGFRPPLALTSVLFLFGLTYCLCLRGFAWWLGYPLEKWLLPLFGPSSLKVRVQLSFFVLALVALLLVGWFTVDFFKDEPAFLSSWLEQLLSLYVFLLLIAGALGIFLANSISDPIVQIGKKLGDTRLQNNEPLQWSREDEIGKLVANYNQMIVDLDKSAAKLAATERESAWREMAKQVAHEIKNPLTPMKLQLQQLLRLEKEDPERAREWSKRVASSIIEQIDGLALIATEFSSFARLPEANAITFDLRTLVQSAYDLHVAGKASGQLTLELPETPTWVHADRDQLLRVLNNLIRNADQALHEQKAPRIAIRLEASSDGFYQLTITDNGTGIPQHIQPKIFQPNFTTKSSGMGLGLAMCKAIVEQAEGTIDFETVLGEGTVFRVNLPVVAAELTP